jgi:hypothetical protein
MVPSKTWFPQALQERAAWYQNFTTQLAILAAGLGFTPAEVADVQADNDAFQFLAQVALEVESYDKAMTAYRKLTLEGENGKTGGELPLPPTYPVTPPTVDPGLFERLVTLVERIRVAPAYTPEDGAALQIIPSKPADLIPEEIKPDPSLKAFPGNVIQADFVRGKTDGIEIQYQVDNSGTWENAGRFVKSPAMINIPENGQATARSVQVRARYVIGNTAVGQYSDTDNISTIP